MPDHRRPLPESDLPGAPAEPERAGGRSAAGRRRSSRTHEAILRAAVELLESTGYGALTMEAIAARAGASKATLYRWWSSKADVVLEAYGAETARRIPPVDSGSLRTDLETFLVRLFESLRHPGAEAAVRGMIAEAQVDETFAAVFRTGFMESRRQVVRTLFEHAQARGELKPDVDVEYAVDSVCGPVWYRLLLGHLPLDAAFASRHARRVAESFGKRHG